MWKGADFLSSPSNHEQRTLSGTSSRWLPVPLQTGPVTVISEPPELSTTTVPTLGFSVMLGVVLLETGTGQG